MAKLVARALASGAWAALAVLLVAGCPGPPSGEAPRGPATQSDVQGGLFESVADNLDRLEQFDSDEVLKQICERLNQWNQQERPQLAWQPDPLVERLSAQLAERLKATGFDRVRFQHPGDALYLQEAVWLRDISTRVRGDRFEDLAVAESLFDWVVRNIQLEPGGSFDPHLPYETLLLGRGTAVERAWIFTLLARQQGLDVVTLAIAGADGPVQPWLSALVAGDRLYLFDPVLGLPLPGASGVATLDAVIADPGLLRKLDLDEAHPYPVAAPDLERIVAYVEGSPASLSKRMALVESRLRGKHRLKLTSPGSSLAARVAKLPHVTDAQLWPMPLEVDQARAAIAAKRAGQPERELVLFQALPTIRRARVLHFKGAFEGEPGAKALYMTARPPTEVIEDYKLPAHMLAKVPRSSVARVEAAQILMMREGKHAASYWLGMVFMEEKDYANAIDFFTKRSESVPGKNPWAASAQYNLARAYEAQGDLDKAIELYQTDTESPQSYGNQLRARALTK